MALEFAPSYPHRRKADGMYESVCLTCFATIATAKHESDLTEADRKHVCGDSPLSQRASVKPVRPN